jgi:hypothetical protein
MFRPLSPARGGSHRQRFGFKLHEDRRSTDTSHDFEDSTNWRGVGRRQAVKTDTTIRVNRAKSQKNLDDPW